MSSEIVETLKNADVSMIQRFINGFDLKLVFSSIQNLLGSNYIIIAAVIFLGYGLLKQLLKLLFIGAIVVLVWMIAQSGVLGPILQSVK